MGRSFIPKTLEIYVIYTSDENIGYGNSNERVFTDTRYFYWIYPRTIVFVNIYRWFVIVRNGNSRKIIF